MLLKAVERRMISDVPLGMFLSGGIDSTAVLMAMTRASEQPVQAFTIGFDEATYDESTHAQVAAQAFNAIHHVEVVRPDVDTLNRSSKSSMSRSQTVVSFHSGICAGWPENTSPWP